MDLKISLNDEIKEDEVVALYAANNWSSAKKPQELMGALRNSHCVVTARVSNRLVGLGNAISDGYLVVYYPHLLVHPDYHSQGIGKKLIKSLQERYSSYHQQMIVSGGDSIEFYKKSGFVRAGKTEAMWIYSGDEH